MTDGGPLVLLVEDEPQMRRFIRASLSSHGYRLLEAESAREAVAMITSHNPEVILLDLGLPDRDGIEITRELREWCKTPIIVISARGREDDKVVALDAGADDYLTKPFGVNELLARIRVALRHAHASPQTNSDQTIVVGDLLLDLAHRHVSRAGLEIHLTPIEYKLLTLLARHLGKVLTHRQILKEVWGTGHESQTHYVRVHMAELRKKIEIDPARPALIVTEPSVGYRLKDA